MFNLVNGCLKVAYSILNRIITLYLLVVCSVWLLVFCLSFDHFIHIYIQVALIARLYIRHITRVSNIHFVMATKVLTELVSLGKELGYDGAELRPFVKEEKSDWSRRMDG